MYLLRKVYFNGRIFFLRPSVGRVYSYPGTPSEVSPQSDKIRSYLTQVDNPFLLEQREVDLAGNYPFFIRWYARFLVFSYHHCYLALYLLSFLRLPVFDNAGKANLAFRTVLKNEDQSVLCLPRSVFISSTSRRFKKNGAMFIGIFLPTRNMHAWVIEDNKIADIYDYYWTMYTPLAILR